MNELTVDGVKIAELSDDELFVEGRLMTVKIGTILERFRPKILSIDIVPEESPPTLKIFGRVTGKIPDNVKNLEIENQHCLRLLHSNCHTVFLRSLDLPISLDLSQHPLVKTILISGKFYEEIESKIDFLRTFAPPQVLENIRVAVRDLDFVYFDLSGRRDGRILLRDAVDRWI